MRKVQNMLEKFALALALVGENVRGAHYMTHRGK